MSILNPNGTKARRLTGKQAAFVNEYMGAARFNASLAAKLAGYRATSKHSFEQIGHENLTKPQIRATIDEHFKLSRMSSEECLVELSALARGNSKDKVRALALLSSHFGLLDGAGRTPAENHYQRASETDRQIEAAIEEIYGQAEVWKSEANQWKDGIKKEVNELNAKGLRIYNAVKERFADSPDVKAFCAAYEEMLNGGQAPSDTADLMMPTASEPAEVEIIPPERRLQPAAVERMIRELETTTRQSIVSKYPNVRPIIT
jgi:hypothetical protein